MSSRLNLLARENKGRQLAEEWVSLLQNMTGAEQVPRISLLERDLLIEQHKIHYKGAVEGGGNTFRRFAMGSEKAKIAAFLRCFGATVRDKVVLYTPKPSEYCGAFLVPLGPVLQRFEELLALDGDVLEIASQDQTNGLVLDWNPGDPLETFELVVWGKEWAGSAGVCTDLPIRPRGRGDSQQG